MGQVRPPGLARPIAKESHLPVDRPGHPWPGRFALLTRQPMRRDSLIAVKCVAQREHEGVMQGSKAWRRNSLIAVKCVAQCEHEGGNGGLRSKASAAWMRRSRLQGWIHAVFTQQPAISDWMARYQAGLSLFGRWIIASPFRKLRRI